MNVLPLVNKSLALFQWKKDGATAEKFCLEALQIDPLCEAAFATLGQIYLAQQQFDQALEKFRALTQISSNAPQLSLTFYHIYVSDLFFTLCSLVNLRYSPPRPRSASSKSIQRRLPASRRGCRDLQSQNMIFRYVLPFILGEAGPSHLRLGLRLILFCTRNMSLIYTSPFTTK